MIPHSPAAALSDSALLAAVAGGDENAFRSLYRLHAPRLRGLAARLLGNPSDGDDAIQETWIRAVSGIQRFRGEGTVAAWLNGIAVRVCWEIIRRRRPTGDLDGEGDAVEPPDSAERIDLEQALQRLPDRYRTVVVLHDVEGFGHDDIASLLAIPVGTSRSHLSRARQLLRAMLCSYERAIK